MPDYRTFFDSECLFAYHLDGREITVTIERVAGGKIGHGKQESSKPFVYFRDKKKPLAINKTNGKTIATLYGKDVRAWIGKQITLYPTTTKFGSETHDCIRVKPSIPNGKSDDAIDENREAPPERKEPTDGR